MYSNCILCICIFCVWGLHVLHVSVGFFFWILRLPLTLQDTHILGIGMLVTLIWPWVWMFAFKPAVTVWCHDSVVHLLASRGSSSLMTPLGDKTIDDGWNDDMTDVCKEASFLAGYQPSISLPRALGWQLFYCWWIPAAHLPVVPHLCALYPLSLHPCASLLCPLGGLPCPLPSGGQRTWQVRAKN